MVLSYCVPCHKRVEDFRRSLPDVISAAYTSPPVEVVVVDYGRTLPAHHDRLDGRGVALRFVLVEAEHYHNAHARNVSIRAASGDYVIISSTDLCPQPAFFAEIRDRLLSTGAAWLQPSDDTFRGVLVIRRDELIAAGGFDERICYYGAEDTDLRERLKRRGLASATYDTKLTMIRTTNAEKVANYGVRMTKTEMLEHGAAIFRENVAAGVLVANEGQAWGQA